jgi:Protein of unknown function (DUF3619)
MHRKEREIAEDQFGHRIAFHLNGVENDLSHNITERLRVARLQAVAHKAPSLQVVLQSPLSNSVFAMKTVGAHGGSGPDGMSKWSRWMTAALLGILVFGFAAVQEIQDELRASDIAEVDSQLLIDDLPPAAFLDPGFTEYLKRSQSN